MLRTVLRSELASLPQDSLSRELEHGRIVFFPECPLPLPGEEDLAFLRTELPALLARKNASYYPTAHRLVGLTGERPVQERVKGLLREHSRHVVGFLTRAMPELTRGWRVGTTSFRPAEVRGRRIKPHADDRLVHVDAGAYGATHGSRILRFFVNVNPTQDRIWLSKGTFAELFPRHARAAGLEGAGPVADGPLGRAWSGALGAAARLFPMVRVIDTSTYDRRMRRFHNYMKDDPSFRDSQEGVQRFAFPPLSAWMVFTDSVSHACIEGQHALVDTFLIPLANCQVHAQTPWHVMQGVAR
jgi:3-deoxy-D-manno-oct-2-ulosonic acid (Kdo) hydroxylase